MIAAFTTQRLRAAEQQALATDTDDTLMRRAAWAVAADALRMMPPPRPGRSVLLLVGSGNNGGDALFAGALLRRRGIRVTAVLAAERAHPAGLAALRGAGGRVVPAPEQPALDGVDLVIDGVVGLGSSRPLAGRAAELVRLTGDMPILAIDSPSGIDPDSGLADGPAVRAVRTVTMGAPSPGLLTYRGTGELSIVELGLRPAGEPDVTALQDADARIPTGRWADDKFSTGVVGIAAGSARYPGAALLCAGAAVSLRPGLVRYAGPAAELVLSRWPEIVAARSVVEAGQVQSWVVGPGLGTDAAAARELHAVLRSGLPAVVDADALTIVAADRGLLRQRARASVVLTPHAGEFARLWPDLDPTRRLESAQAAARTCGQVVLLKGDRTVIADPDGRTAVNLTGCPALATAGSGDVLSGMIGSLLAGGMPVFEAAAIAAHRHGRAGERLAAAGRAGASALVEQI